MNQPVQFFPAVSSTYPLSAVGQFTKNDALMLTIRRRRTTSKMDPDSRLPEELRKINGSEDFILFEGKKLIIFTTTSNLSILEKHKHWFADGTFKVIYQLSDTFLSQLFFNQVFPDNYYQLFTLHAMMNNIIMRLFYELLISKSVEDYNLFFQKVLEQDSFLPESLVIDFESSTIKLVKETLPNVLHKGQTSYEK